MLARALRTRQLAPSPLATLVLVLARSRHHLHHPKHKAPAYSAEFADAGPAPPGAAAKPPASAAGAVPESVVLEHAIENDVYDIAKDQVVADVAPPPTDAGVTPRIHILTEAEAAVYANAKDEVTPFADDVVDVKKSIFKTALDEELRPLDERFRQSSGAQQQQQQQQQQPRGGSIRKDDAATLAAAAKIRTSMLHARPSPDTARETLLRMQHMREHYERMGIQPDSVDAAADFGTDRPHHEHADYAYVMDNLPPPKDDALSTMKGTYDATKTSAGDAFQTSEGMRQHVAKLNEERTRTK